MPSRTDAPPAHMATRCGQEDRKIIKITRAARAKVRLVPRILNLRGNAAMFPLYFPEKKPQPDVVKVTASGRAGAPDFSLVLKLRKP
jgi:hypothetical protein